jgi:hypothetical protein
MAEPVDMAEPASKETHVGMLEAAADIERAYTPAVPAGETAAEAVVEAEVTPTHTGVGMVQPPRPVAHSR